MFKNENKYEFSSLEDAKEKLNLDKRIFWFEFNGKVVRRKKGDKLGHELPESLIINNEYVYINRRSI